MAGATAGAAALSLTVAGVRLAFRADPGLVLAAPGFEYPPFLADHPAARRVAITVGGGPSPALPGAARLLFDTGDGWRLLGAGPRRWLQMPERARGAPGACLWQVSWREPLGEAHAWAGPALLDGGVVRHLVQYPLDQVLLTQALLPEQGLLLHAAGAATPDAGVAFAGVSGAGKSTVTRLLDGRPGFRFVSDDRVFVRPRGTGYDLHGTPWAGDARIARPEHAPLSAICFLRQHDRCALVPLAPAAALDRLLAVATVPWFDAAATANALDACARLLSRVPCYELAFSRDAAAIAGALAELRRAA